MKEFLYFAVLAIVSSCAFAQQWKDLCKDKRLGEKVYHPHTCTKYIDCIGYGEEMDCPPKTHFNLELQVCDWPERAGCEGGGSTANPGPTVDPTQNPNPNPGPSPNPSPNPWEPYCKNQKLGKHINHPHTCEKYIVCIGHGQEMDCPPRTHFNKDLEVCDWPERAGCQDGGSTSDPGPTVDPTQNPNPNPGPSPNPSPNPWEPYCKNQKLGKHINHPHTCEKYIVCIGHGQEMDCPPRTHFNNKLGVCDWPERAGCQDGGSTSDPDPTVDPTQNPNPNPGPSPNPSPNPWEPYCKNQKLGKHINHPHTCEKYIVCIGHGQEMNCPPRTHFNNKLGVCDWPERAGCQDGGSTSDPDPTVDPTQNPNPNPGPSPNPSPNPWEPYCRNQKLGKHINHPHTCEKYIVCIGHGQEMDCPPRTHFNNKLGVCDWPERAGCQDGGSTSDPGPTVDPTQNPNPNPGPSPNPSPNPWEPYCRNQKLGKHINHPHTCEKYIVCIGHGQEMNCPPRTHFNKDLEVCDWPERAGCQDGGSTSDPEPTVDPTQNPNPNPGPSPNPSPNPWEPYCKNQKLGKHINHPHTCEKYIVCIGHGEEMDCPPRTHFNKELEVCDWPERAGCQDGGSTSNPGPTIDPTSGPTVNPNPPSPWDKHCEGLNPGTHIKHPDTCEKYIVCNGHGEEMDCPPKTHFSEELQVCDWPERANCVEKFNWKNFFALW